MQFVSEAWIDWPPEKLAAAIHANAEEASLAVPKFGIVFPEAESKDCRLAFSMKHFLKSLHEANPKVA